MENLKCASLSERSQSENATFYIILTIGNPGKGTTLEKIKRSKVARLEVGRDKQAEHKEFLGQ